MKKIIVSFAILIIVAIVLGATSVTPKDPNATLNNTQDVTNGQNTFRSYTFIDTFNGATSCSTAWMQWGYDFDATTQTGNSLIMKVGAREFAVFVDNDSISGDSAYIGTMRYELSLDAIGSTIYTTADSSCYVIGLSDSATTASVSRVYPMYVPGCLYLRLISTSTGIDTFKSTVTVMGINQ